MDLILYDQDYLATLGMTHKCYRFKILRGCCEPYPQIIIITFRYTYDSPITTSISYKVVMNTFIKLQSMPGGTT